MLVFKSSEGHPLPLFLITVSRNMNAMFNMLKVIILLKCILKLHRMEKVVDTFGFIS